MKALIIQRYAVTWGICDFVHKIQFCVDEINFCQQK